MNTNELIKELQSLELGNLEKLYWLIDVELYRRDLLKNEKLKLKKEIESKL